MPEEQVPHYKKMLTPFFSIALIALSIYLVSLTRNTWKANNYIGKSAQTVNTVTISGKGRVFALPDIATVSLGLRTEKKIVSLAHEENIKKINQLHEELKKINIPKEDIATTQYNVNLEYDWNEGKQNLRGYSINQSVSVKIRDFDKISKVLQIAGDLELNHVGSLNFMVDDINTFQIEARIDAIKDAKEKAKILAKEADIKLGKIVSINESTNTPYPQPYYKDYAMGESAGSTGAVAPQIEPGNQEVTIQLSITYEVL